MLYDYSKSSPRSSCRHLYPFFFCRGIVAFWSWTFCLTQFSIQPVSQSAAPQILTSCVGSPWNSAHIDSKHPMPFAHDKFSSTKLTFGAGWAVRQQPHSLPSLRWERQHWSDVARINPGSWSGAYVKNRPWQRRPCQHSCRPAKSPVTGLLVTYNLISCQFWLQGDGQWDILKDYPFAGNLACQSLQILENSCAFCCRKVVSRESLVESDGVHPARSWI